eukprot:1179460-Prorocentrum_minimum.AAC.5
MLYLISIISVMKNGDETPHTIVDRSAVPVWVLCGQEAAMHLTAAAACGGTPPVEAYRATNVEGNLLVLVDALDVGRPIGLDGGVPPQAAAAVKSMAASCPHRIPVNAGPPIG